MSMKRTIWTLFLLSAAGLGLLLLTLTLQIGGSLKPPHIQAQDFCITQVITPNLGDEDNYGFDSVTTEITALGTYKTTGLVVSQDDRRAFTCTTQVTKGSVFLVEWTLN